MKNDLDSQEVAKLIGAYIRFHKPELTALMHKHGAKVSATDNNNYVSAAFVVLMQKPAFRKDFGDLVKSTMGMKTARSLVNFTGNENYMNSTGYTGIGPSPDPTLSGASGNSSSNSGGGFSDYMKKLFTPERVGNLLDSGLNIFASTVKSQNDQKTAQKLIDLNSSTPVVSSGGSSDSGMSTNMKIVIGVGIVGAIAALYFAFRKK